MCQHVWLLYLYKSPCHVGFSRITQSYWAPLSNVQPRCWVDMLGREQWHLCPPLFPNRCFGLPCCRVNLLCCAVLYCRAVLQGQCSTVLPCQPGWSLSSGGYASLALFSVKDKYEAGLPVTVCCHRIIYMVIPACVSVTQRVLSVCL